MQVIFEVETGERSVDEALSYRLTEADSNAAQAEFAGQLVRGVLGNREAIDSELTAASSHWRLDQMAKVERAVLRLATYEILFAREVPVRAAINESIELAKTFGGEESGRFVNGVLGRIAERAAADRPEPG